jgi:hypothetical protein
MLVLDFWKTLLSAGLGFLGGLLAEPLRMEITNGVKMRQMRKALYRDALRAYWGFGKVRTALPVGIMTEN